MSGPLVVLFVCIGLLYVDGMPIDDASPSNHHYFHDNQDHFTAQLLRPLFGPWIGGSQKFGYKGSVNRGHPEFLPTELLLGSGLADVGSSRSEYEESLFGPNGGDRPEFQYESLDGLADVGRPKYIDELIFGLNRDHPKFPYSGLFAGSGSAHIDRPESELEGLLFGSNDGDRPEFPNAGWVLDTNAVYLGRSGPKHNEWFFSPEGGDSRS